jgi:flavin reductase (DIM6/NTAB) family NADH-FMN oxidoreductase RutF
MNTTTSSEPTISLSVDDFNPSEMYFLLRDSVLPRPIAWVSTVSRDGVHNLAPFSFFNVCCPSPPVMGFSCGPRGDNHNLEAIVSKDTLQNIRDTGEFVINISPEGLFEQMVDSAQDLPATVSEFDALGIASLPCDLVGARRVALTPIAFECRLNNILPLGKNHWVMGDVVKVHILERVYQGERDGKRHRVDLMKESAMRPLGRLGRAFYCKLTDVMLRARKNGPN